jgi:hypothetical protein
MGLDLGLTAGVVALTLTAVFRASVILVIVGTTAEAAGRVSAPWIVIATWFILVHAQRFLTLVVHPSVTGYDASLASQACTSETAYIQSEIIVGISQHQWVERIELY